MFSRDDADRIRHTVCALTGVALNAEVDARKGQNGLNVCLNGQKALIEAEDKSALARGYFLLCRAVKEHKTTLDIHEARHFASCGAMLDFSRGGVMKAEAVRRYIDHMAALGMNLLLLYTEDTYTVPEYPYLGYLRGRYSMEELKEIDAYAASMGVELVPCIQTLGHLGQFLQWQENADMKDQPTVLMADEEKVYRFIEAEIRAVRACFQSNRIHIGMDEAHGVGLGRYFEKHGLTDRFALLNRHLNRVVAICKDNGFSPMMWSDMFFRLGSKDNEYYDLNADIPQRVIDGIPDVDLCYWDYYHTDNQMYEHMLNLHEKLKKNTVFAGGIWTWSGFLPHVQWTDATMKPALRACARHHVQTVMATLWGDDGTETNYFLADSQLALFSEYCWQGPDCADSEIAAMGECLTGLPRRVYDAFGLFYPGAVDLRTGKGLIWCDLLYPLMEYEGDTMENAAARAKKALEILRPCQDRADCRYATLLFQTALQKAEIISVLRANYLKGDREYLRFVANEAIPALLASYDALLNAHRAQWEGDMKRFGWELLCLRYGAVTGRLRDVREELSRYLNGEIDKIPELEETPLPSARKGGMQFYQVYVSPQFSL